MRRIAGFALAALLTAAGCADDDAGEAVGSTTARLTPGYRYTDCSKVRAGDDLGRNAPEMLCDPANNAKLETLDCAQGTYVHLRRPEGDLEGLVGRTEWREAGSVDPQTGRTPLAFTECEEH